MARQPTWICNLWPLGDSYGFIVCRFGFPMPNLAKYYFLFWFDYFKSNFIILSAIAWRPYLFCRLRLTGGRYQLSVGRFEFPIPKLSHMYNLKDRTFHSSGSRFELYTPIGSCLFVKCGRWNRICIIELLWMFFDQVLYMCSSMGVLMGCWVMCVPSTDLNVPSFDLFFIWVRPMVVPFRHSFSSLCCGFLFILFTAPTLKHISLRLEDKERHHY